jgi:hypothetical protein
LLPLVEGISPIGGLRGRPRCKPDLVQADHGYDSQPHRRALAVCGIAPRLPVATPNTAAAWKPLAGWSSAPSLGCISSAACGCATNADRISTRRSSNSAVPLSAGASWLLHEYSFC